MGKKVRKCCICGEKLPVGKFGNTPEPIKLSSEGVCCDTCFRKKVIPARILQGIEQNNLKRGVCHE